MGTKKFTLYTQAERRNWGWYIIQNQGADDRDGIVVASSENGDGEYVAYATEASALTDAARVLSTLLARVSA